MSSPHFLPFAQPDIGEEEIAEVADTLRSGWITTGPKTARFEADFSAFLGDPGLHSLAANSATAGLHLALEAVGIGPGDEVITTTHTFTATAEVVRYLGADVKLVDIDPATLNIDPAATDALRVYDITAKTMKTVPNASGARNYAWAPGGTLYFAKERAGSVAGWIGLTDKGLALRGDFEEISALLESALARG